jgi:hypothetical protein
MFQVSNSGGVDKQMRRQDGDILVVEGTVIIVRVAGEVISPIGGTGFVDKFEVKVGHLWEVSGDVVTNLLGVSIILQV